MQLLHKIAIIIDGLFDIVVGFNDIFGNHMKWKSQETHKEFNIIVIKK